MCSWQFELVCGLEFLNQMTTMLYMIGAVIGGVASGALADRYSPWFLIFD